MPRRELGKAARRHNGLIPGRDTCRVSRRRRVRLAKPHRYMRDQDAIDCSLELESETAAILDIAFVFK
jgi:hypothetical protein